MTQTHSAAHHKISTIKRSAGRSAVAAAAYRHCAKFEDERTGLTHDYRRKKDLVAQGVIGWQGRPSELWNAAEAAENRKNSVTARETVLALPHELDRETQERLVKGHCLYLRDRHGVASSYVIHDPDPKKGGQQNTHAHILWTTREVDADGQFGKKTRVLDDKKTGSKEFEHMRASWAKRVNTALEKAGVESRVDHRSLERRAEAGDAPAQEPQEHRGPARHAIAKEYKRTAEKAQKAGQRTPKPPHFYREELRTKKRNAALRGLWNEVGKPKKEKSGDGQVRDGGDGTEAEALADTGRLVQAALDTGSLFARAARKKHEQAARARARAAAQQPPAPKATPPAPATPAQRPQEPQASGLVALLRRGLEASSTPPAEPQAVKSAPTPPKQMKPAPDSRFAALRTPPAATPAQGPQEPQAPKATPTPPRDGLAALLRRGLEASSKPQEPQAVKETQTPPEGLGLSFKEDSTKGPKDTGQAAERSQEPPKAPQEVRSRADTQTARNAAAQAAARIAAANAPKKRTKQKKDFTR